MVYSNSSLPISFGWAENGDPDGESQRKKGRHWFSKKLHAILSCSTNNFKP